MLQKKLVLLMSSLFFWSFSFAQKNSDSLIVFVGQKIEVHELKFENPIKRKEIIGRDTVIHSEIYMDGKFAAKYKILKLLNGHYKADTIEFIAWDHYGLPAFSKYEHVLLYVYPEKNGFVHEKYQFSPVYLTKENKWAGPYDANDYKRIDEDDNIKPRKIPFKKEILIDLKNLTDELVKFFYPKPYYKVSNQQAKALYGNYIEELFKLKQLGILNARGYY